VQIALVNASALADIDVALMAEACNAQVIECARAWGIAPTPVAFYSTADGLPAVECRIMLIVDQLDVPGALGYHTDKLGAIYGRVLNQGPVDTCKTLSHECLEMLVDPTCTGWRPLGGGRDVALEVCDPVQADVYATPATVVGISRDMWLSNYVTPRWFDPAGVGAFDRMGVLSAPLAMASGGYIIVREKDGDVVNVFAKTPAGDMGARLNVASKIARPGSRTLRRLRG
jgi:hypothetical protein